MSRFSRGYLWNEDLSALFGEIRSIDSQYRCDDLLSAVRELLSSQEPRTRIDVLMGHYQQYPNAIGRHGTDKQLLDMSGHWVGDWHQWEYDSLQCMLMELCLLLRANLSHDDFDVALDYAKQHTSGPEWLVPVILDPLFACVKLVHYSTQHWIRLNPALVLLRHVEISGPASEVGPLGSNPLSPHGRGTAAMPWNNRNLLRIVQDAYLNSGVSVGQVETLGLAMMTSDDLWQLLGYLGASRGWRSLKRVYLRGAQGLTRDTYDLIMANWHAMAIDELFPQLAGPLEILEASGTASRFKPKEQER